MSAHDAIHPINSTLEAGDLLAFPRIYDRTKGPRLKLLVIAIRIALARGLR